MQGQSGFAYVPSLSTNGDSFCFLLQDGIFVDIFGGLHAAVCQVAKESYVASVQNLHQLKVQLKDNIVHLEIGFVPGCVY